MSSRFRMLAASSIMALVVSAATALTAVGAADAQTPAQTAIAALNVQRAANGLPAAITENSAWSDACAKHMNYLRVNNIGLSHDEDPSLPGYTTEGAWAGQHSVLSMGHGWFESGENPFEDAPIHLMQTLGPALAVTGSATGCLTTWPGYTRETTGPPALYSYPGDGVRGVTDSMTASESPFVPGDFVGLPQGTVTGPHLYVFAWPAEAARVTAASLTGPDGPVEVRTVDNSTTSVDGRHVGSYLPPGAIMIAVAPLRPGATYHAQVTLDVTAKYHYDQASQQWVPETVALTRSWTFEVRRADPQTSLKPDIGGLHATSLSPQPITARVYRGDSQVAVVTLKAGQTVALDIPGGVYRIVYQQPEDPLFRAAAGWLEGGIHARVTLTFGAVSRPAARRLRVGVNAPAWAYGAYAHVTIRSLRRVCAHGRCINRRVGRPGTLGLILAADSAVTVATPAAGRLVSLTAGADNNDQRYIWGSPRRTLTVNARGRPVRTR